MTEARASQLILARINDQARTFDKPSVRLASIERLVAACDALESGAAAEAIKSVYGSDGGLGRNPKINPSSIEKYVKARFDQGARDWTGPTRVFIASDKDLKAYVNAREDERSKPMRTQVRPSDRQKEIEDSISQISSVEMRQMLRHDLEEGRLAKRRLDLLTRGLRAIPAIDVDALLRGSDKGGSSRMRTGTSPEPRSSGVLTGDELRTLQALLTRLNDADEMRRVGLELTGLRLRMAFPPGTTIIRPDEMAVLHRLVSPDASE